VTKFVDSPDGVKVAYTSEGEREPALIFVHGGLADRTFWSNQIEVFSPERKVVALDLPGHGESGRNRSAWSLQAFGHDILAVMDSEQVGRAVLIGNSLGGPAVVEAALLAPERAIGIVAVDTFHTLDYRVDPAEVRARAEAFRTDFIGSMKQMLRMLFHPDADPVLVGEIERRMAGSADEGLWRMFESFADYDQGASVRGLKVPIRCLNGDLFPTNIEENRRTYADFDAVIFPHTGHYPMLECPEQFNRQLAAIVEFVCRHR
jgi:pimeloyl-ACP methyl ester carboxylesterase